MTFSRANPSGWVTGERLTSTQANAIDSTLPKAVDGDAGGTYTPSSTLSLASLHCPTTPATGNAVANKTYVDAEVTSAAATAAAATAAVASDLSTFEAKFAIGANVSTANASNLTNISSVNTIRVQRSLVSQYFWIVGVYASVTNSGSGTKSFELDITQLGTISSINNVIGSGNVFNASNSPKNQGLMIYGVNSTTRVIIEWNDTQTTGSSILRGTFTYYA